MSAPIPATAWKSTEQGPARILIVDDSVVVRSVLERIFTATDTLAVAHKTSNAEQALAFLARDRVDIVLLDVEMPGQSGLAALPAILKAGLGAKVIILSGNCEEGSAAAVEALALGASDIISKPGRGSFGNDFSEALIARLLRIVRRRPVAPEPALPVSLRPLGFGRQLACLGIGASTGGIHALGQLLSGITQPLGVPLLLTQHLPPSFIPFFAIQLGRMTTMPVKVAEQGETLLPDRIYIAPGGANLECRKSWNGQVHVVLTEDCAPSGSLPAVDPMFAAMADAYGPACGTIVLTGMGRDGTAGGRKVIEQGGWLIAQDEDSSVVWGMPGSATRAGLASAVLPPQDIMTYIARRVGVGA
ncbi:MAG: chemotaxis response regulator protein-glutamate methylesterase [Sphingobium sp.]|nr:MAG: chemotaxis response regulator protein-glutamate methylesterase [Sphingobium sp.]